MEEKHSQTRIFIRRGSSFSSPDYYFSGSREKQSRMEKLRSAMTNVFDSIVSASLFFIFLGLPLFFIGFTYQGIAFEKQIYFYFFLLLALVCWAARGVIEGELKIRRTPLDIPIIIFWLAYLLSTIFSVDRWHSFWGFFGDPSRGLMSVTALIIAYYLVFDRFNSGKLKLILTAIAAAGLINLIWTSLGIMGIKFLPQNWLDFSPLSLAGSISGAGVFVSLLLPFLLACVFIVRQNEKMGIFRKRAATAALLLGIVLNIFLLLALYNYIPWAGLLIGLGVFLIYILSRIVRPAEAWTWLPMAVFVVVMAIVMVGGANLARVQLPVEISPAHNLSWEIARNSVKDNFILGSGPATYGYDFSLHKPENFNQNYFFNLRFYQGTGMLAEGLATLGAFGVISFLLLLFSCISVIFYLITIHKEKNKVFSLGLLSMTVIFIVHSLAARTEGFVLIFGSLIGALTLASLLLEDEAEERYLNLSLKTSPKYALALAFIFMLVTAGVAYLFVFVGKSLSADVYAGLAVRESEVSESGSISKLARAVNLNPQEGRYFTRVGQEYMALANSEMLKKEEERNIEEVQRYLNLAIQASARGRDLMKNDVLAVESLAQIYENAGLYVPESLGLAEETYRRAGELEIHNPIYPVKIGQIKMSQAALSEDEKAKKELLIQAKELFGEAAEKKNDLPAAYYHLSAAREALEETDEAIENMKTAFRLERNNITYAFNLARLYQERGSEEDNKMAEDLFRQILGVNDKEINTRFSLGLLFEKTGRGSEAIGEYQKVIELLSSSPAGENENSDEARQRIEKMIENIQSGSSNLDPDPGAPAAEPESANIEETEENQAENSNREAPEEE